MKFVKSYLIQKAEGKKTGKYLITLEVTDNDINMFEDLCMSYVPFELNKIYKDDCEVREIKDIDFDYKTLEVCDFTDKYSKWINKLFFGCFHKLWREYD